MRKPIAFKANGESPDRPGGLAAASAARASTHSLKADSIEASWGCVMGRPAKFRFFTCPSCAALYQVVMAEAGPETKAAELACLICGAPLSPAMESSS